MIKLKELKTKKIWDLTLDEIDCVYNNLHMNNFIYAALKMYHESNPPLNKIIKIKKEKIPECLYKYAEKLVNLSPYLGNDDARILRINYKYYAYNLFRMLKYVRDDEIPEVMSFFSSLAYIPIIVEKNDDFDLWKHEVVRELTEELKKQFKVLISNPDINDFLDIIWSDNNKNKYNDLDKDREILVAMKLSIQIIIAHCENNIDKKELVNAWENLENIMLLLEKDNDIDTNNEINRFQFRYRNSLYLYGGDFFRRITDYKKALEWYLKDIELEKKIKNSPPICQTRMRTIERLLCAYIIGEKIKMDTKNIKDIIDDKLHVLFKYLSISNEELIDYINKLDLDLSDERLIYTKERKREKEKDGLIKRYVNESSREFFLLALLYNNIINKVDYKDIEYSKFLDFTL
jgi:hypothetical protein